MAPRKMKDMRGPTDAVKEEPVNEEASSALGENASHKKKRGRPRKAASASTPAAAYLDGEGAGDDDVEGEEEGEASNEEGDDAEDQKGAIALLNEQKRGVIVMKKKTRRVSTTHHSHRHALNNDGKDGLDLQSELHMKGIGRTNKFHRRKGKPTRAAHASF